MKKFLGYLFVAICLVGPILLALFLSGCAAVPEPVIQEASAVMEMPVPGEVQVGDISFVMPTEEPRGSLIIAAYERYDPNPWDMQEIHAEFIVGGKALAGVEVKLCVEEVCVEDGTDEWGNAYGEFEGEWPVGSVPWRACVEWEGEEVCMKSSFMAEEVSDD